MAFNRPPVGAELPIKKEQHGEAQGATKQLRLCSLYERIQHPSGHGLKGSISHWSGCATLSFTSA